MDTSLLNLDAEYHWFWMVVVKHKRVHQGNGYPATQATRSVRKRYILKMEWDPKAFDFLGFHMRQFFFLDIYRMDDQWCQFWTKADSSLKMWHRAPKNSIIDHPPCKLKVMKTSCENIIFKNRRSKGWF